uniref:Uncharacterized protein n=1 Tax=Strigamia maritima TaxID=126957 RepID=T1IV71_STRMM
MRMLIRCQRNGNKEEKKSFSKKMASDVLFMKFESTVVFISLDACIAVLKVNQMTQLIITKVITTQLIFAKGNILRKKGIGGLVPS